jgi:hypothetical protein
VASLNVHQSKSSDHDRLGFHPDCPVCRQDRLFGVLSPEPLLSRRARVLLATGVLALSAGVTSTSVATEPDQQQEGIVLPGPGEAPPDETSGGPDAPADDELGQGSDGETPLPLEVDPVLSAPEDDTSDGGADDSGPLEAEPIDDPEGRLPLAEPDAPEGLDADDVPTPPVEPAPPVAPGPPVAPPPDAGDPSESPPAPVPERTRRAQEPHRDHSRNGSRKVRRRQRETESPTAPTAPEAPAGQAQPAPTYNDSSEPAPSVAVSAQAGPAPVGAGSFHVVRPGESLWSIATKLLGPGASAAAIAGEVSRLWQLNRERMGTGDPSLLMIGVKLRLR